MLKKLRILLADDDMDDRFFFDKALKKIGIEATLETVEDGEKLVVYLLKHLNNLPNILFLDLNMPRKNGSECLLQIKAHSKLKEIPVVIYSTSLHEDVADVLFKNGAHHYIQKPDFTDLPIVLETVINRLIKSNYQRPARKEFIVRLNSIA